MFVAVKSCTHLSSNAIHHALFPSWPCTSDGRAVDMYLQGRGFESHLAMAIEFFQWPGFIMYHLIYLIKTSSNVTGNNRGNNKDKFTKLVDFQ